MIADILEVKCPCPSLGTPLSPCGVIALPAVVFDVATLMGRFYLSPAVAAIDGMMEVDGLILSNLKIAEVADWKRIRISSGSL